MVQKYWNRGLPLIASGHCCLLHAKFCASWRLSLCSGTSVRSSQDVAASFRPTVVAAAAVCEKMMCSVHSCVLLDSSNLEFRTIAKRRDRQRQGSDMFGSRAEAKAPGGERQPVRRRLAMTRPLASSGGRGVGSEVAFLDKSSRGRERRCILRRGRPDPCNRKRGRFRFRKYSTVGPPLFLGRVFGVRFRSPACGCRFGSGRGRLWVCVCRPWFYPWFCSVSVGSHSGRKKGTDPKKPAVIRRSRQGRYPQYSMFWDFGSLHHKHRVCGPPGCKRRDGSDGWRSPVPGLTILGRGCVHPPPTIASSARRQFPKFVTDVLWTVYEIAGPVLPDGRSMLLLFFFALLVFFNFASGPSWVSTACIRVAVLGLSRVLWYDGR